MMNDMPVFVKVEDYKDALDVMNMIRLKIEDAKRTLEKIQELKSEEDTELELWHTTIEEVERKIDFIDKTLSEPGAM
ncbi:MAG TPA: hypothetical protein VJB66_02060 [Candidatus Nanoarchaeia archaeon]|nr:hypothetical protein [Candidatus Nanoarchaeia archaeon]